MKPTLNLNFPLEAIAALDRLGETQAISTYRSGLTGAKLSRIIRGFARRLEAFGVDRNSTLLISFEDGVQTMIAALAASLLGAAWAIYDDGLPFRELRNLRVVSDPKLKVKNYPQAIVDRNWFSGTSTNGAPFRGYSSPSEVFAVAPSSGTTGTPKYMFREAGSLSLEFGVVRRLLAHPNDAVPTLSIRMAAGSYLGFALITGALVQGARVMLANPKEQLAGEFAQMLNANVTHMLGSPTQIAGVIAGTPAPAARMKALLAGGAIITPRMLETWLRYFETVVLAYGSRESACLAFCTFNASRDTRDLAYDIEPDGKCQVVDAYDSPLPNGTQGTLRFQRPHMVTSYLGDADTSSKVFRDGWYYSGDLGYLDADGRLHITGRLHDQINLGGIKFNASAVDTAAASVEGVEAAMCFTTERSDGVSELRLCLCLHPDSSLSQVEKAVRRVVRTAVRAEVAAIYEVSAIPANENGKPLRQFGEKLTAGLHPA